MHTDWKDVGGGAFNFLVGINSPEEEVLSSLSRQRTSCVEVRCTTVQHGYTRGRRHAARDEGVRPPC